MIQQLSHTTKPACPILITYTVNYPTVHVVSIIFFFLLLISKTSRFVSLIIYIRVFPTYMKKTESFCPVSLIACRFVH